MNKHSGLSLSKFSLLAIFIFLFFPFISSTDYTLYSDQDICLKSNTSSGYNFYQLRLQQDGFHDFSDNPLSCTSISYDSSHLIVLTYNFKNGSVFHEYVYNDACTYYYFVPFNSSFFTIATYGNMIEFEAGDNFNLSTIISSIDLEVRYKLSGDWHTIPSVFPDYRVVYSITNITQNTNCPDPVDIYNVSYSDLLLDYHGVSLHTYYPWRDSLITWDVGQSILPKFSMNLTGFVKDPVCNATTGYLRYFNGTLISSVNFSDEWANFSSNISLIPNERYVLSVDAMGSLYNFTSSVSGFPISHQYLTWNDADYTGWWNNAVSNFHSCVTGVSFCLQNASAIDLLPDETIYLSPNSEFLFNWSDYEIPGYNFDSYSYNWAYLKKISPSGGQCWPDYEVLISYPDNETFTDNSTYSYNPGVTCYFGYDRSISEDVIRLTTGDYDTTFSLRVLYCSAIGSGYGCDDKIITFVVTGGIQETGVVTLADFFPKPDDISTYKWLGFVIIGCFLFFGIMLVCVPLRWSSFSLIILFLLFLVGTFFTALNGFVSWAWFITPVVLAVVYFVFKLLGGFS